MVALDWATLLDAVLNGIGDVVTAIVGAFTTHATLIASLVIGAALVAATVRFGRKALNGFSGMVKKIMPR